MESHLPAPSPPWRFRLMVLTALGVVGSSALIVQATRARRFDAQGHAALGAELRRLDAAQSTWAARHGAYAERLADVEDAGTLAFTPSPDVILRFERRSPQGWSATVESRLPIRSPKRCGLYRGSPDHAPHRAVTRPGVVACW